MKKVQKTSGFECNFPSSEPFIINGKIRVRLHLPCQDTVPTPPHTHTHTHTQNREGEDMVPIQMAPQPGALKLVYMAILANKYYCAHK